MAAQAISNIFIGAKLADSTQQKEGGKDREFYLQKIVEQSPPSFLKKCALYILIDEMLATSEGNSPTEKKKKVAGIAKALLYSSSPSVMVRSARHTDPREYIEKILQAAEARANEECPLKQAATELRKKFKEAVEYFSEQWENTPSASEMAQQFVASWQKFTKLLLEERANTLNS